MRLDLLVWTIVEKVIPEYEEKVQRIIKPTGLSRDAASWRKEFKREWRRCEVKQTSDPDEFPYTKYNPDPCNWKCACPAYRDSRFLICKHLIQLCCRVSPRFFIEVNRARQPPFWSHPSLIPLENLDDASLRLDPPEDDLNFNLPDWESDSDDDFDDAPSTELAATYASQMDKLASDLEDLAKIIRHQIPFKEVRLLSRAQAETARARRWHSSIQELEKINNSRNSIRPNTWNQASTMFIYTRPASS
jgi:hypothetical protein